MKQHSFGSACFYSAKIKPLLIQLHDYSFFHSPSEIGDVDKRFLGRKAIAKKLRAILTRSHTQSGAYLVTGYRGVGKSSFVAKVLSDIGLKQSRSGYTSRFSRIFLPLIPLSLLDPYQGVTSVYTLFAFWIPCSLFILCLLVLVRDGRNLNSSPSWGGGLKLLFSMTENRTASKRLHVLMQDFVFLSVIHLTGLFLTNSLSSGQPQADTILRFSIYVSLYLLFLIYILCSIVYRRTCRRRRYSKRGSPRVRDFFSEVTYGLKRFVNYSDRVFISVNLGQDDLSDTDVLRLISQTIYIKYRDFVRYGLADKLWRMLRIIAVFWTAGTIYYYLPIYNLNQALKVESQLVLYCPSQGAFLIGGVEKLQELIQQRPLRLKDFSSNFQRALVADYDDLAPKLAMPENRVRRASVLIAMHLDLTLQTLYIKIRSAVREAVFQLAPDFARASISNLNNLPGYFYSKTSFNQNFQVLPPQLDYFTSVPL